MNKVIVLDFSIYMFRSIFASLHNPNIPPTYTCLASILGNLKRIGVDKSDTILIACDDKKNWRKEEDKEYKSNRKEQREKYPINWDKMWKDFNYLQEHLKVATDWHILKVPYCLLGNTKINFPFALSTR